MQLTIGEVLDRIDAMKSIVRQIESGIDVKYCINDIADYLDEYIDILSNTKVKI